MAPVIHLGDKLLDEAFMATVYKLQKFAKEFHIKSELDAFYFVSEYEIIWSSYHKFRDHIKATYGIHGGAECKCVNCFNK